MKDGASNDRTDGAEPPRVQWEGAIYDQISDPQYLWGRRVLARLAPSLRGDELALDAGCGTGRLTADLAAALPRGAVFGLDRNASMLAVARRKLPAAIPLVRADLLALPFRAAFDLVFSTATFHWVLDHPALFREIHAALRPGGRLVAQCGGAGNLAGIVRHIIAAMSSPAFAPHFATWKSNTHFAEPVTTVARLRAAGFADAHADLEPAPARFPTRQAFTEFAAGVVLRSHLTHLTTDALRESFLEAVTNLAAGDDPPFTMDYVRLNLTALRN